MSAPLIVHVIHHLVIGGMENGLVNLVNKLPRDRYRHAILCIEDFSDFRLRIERDDVEVIALHRSQGSMWQLRRRLWQEFRRLRPAMVHTRGLSGLDALLPARLAGVRHCLHGEHGWDVDDLHGHSRKRQWLRRLHAPLVSRYITVSRDLERFLTGPVGIDPGRVTAICNGVDTARFAPEPGQARDWLPDGFCEPGCVIVGTVGRLQPVKDQALLLKALRLCLDRQPALAARLRLVLVGDGPQRESLRAECEALGLQPVCHFAGSRKDVAHVLRGFDVFALPSLNEGISNTILEAMASALPVVATRVGGNVELVEDGQTGALFAPGDVSALADLWLAYLANPELLRRHARNARERAVSQFSIQTMLNNYRRVYDELLYQS